MKEKLIFGVFAFFITTNLFSQWNIIDKLQNVKAIQTKNDSLIVATENGIYYLDSKSNITLLDSGDTLKNIYKIKVIGNNIYAASEETIYTYSAKENNWEPVINPNKYLVDFYIVDTLYARAEGWDGIVKNFYNDSIIYKKWSDVLSTGGWFGSIEYYNNKFFMHRAFGNMDIIHTDKRCIQMSPEALKSNSIELWATEMSELTEDWLYAVFPCSDDYQCDNKGSVNWFDYKTNDSISFIDSVNLINISAHSMDVYKEQIFIGGDSGRVSIINQLSKEIAEDTIPNIIWYQKISNIKANADGIYAVIDGTLYFKKNQTRDTKIQFVGQEKFHIYPTISESAIHIGGLKKNSEYAIEIVDLNGTTIYSDKIYYNTDPYAIYIDNISNGLYMIHILSDTKVESAFFIKK